MKRFPAQTAPLLAIALIVLIAALAGWQLLSLMGLPLSKDEYNLAVWEVQHFPDKWLYLAGHVGDNSSREKDNADVARYLQLQRDVDELQAKLSQESGHKRAGRAAAGHVARAGTDEGGAG